MRFVTGRTGRDWLRPAVFCILALFLLGAGASASGQGAEEVAIRAALESYLRAYQEKAMLYEDRDLRAGTVIDPDLHMPPGSGDAVFRFSGKDVTLSRLQSDMAYLEQKAAFYAGMRQMQEIYRENLRLTYALEELEREGSACRVSVKETAAFRYTDSEVPSVYETGYSVRLVRLGDRWLVAGAGSGSLFDKTYQESGLDADAALAAFAKELETEDCRLSFPAGDSGGNRIAYRGADAAAYAYTYSRREADMPRDAFYNPFFFGYAGEGGDCQNFASQCIWAGFGGSEEAGAIRGQTLPMDPAGENRWFGRPASGGSYTNSWLSCQSFRQYLTGSRDASGRGGSNGGSDTGIYASVLDVGAGSPLSAVTPEELVGAAAHVEGGGGRYAHAIVLTAAEGTRRSEIWFCSHTSDMTHVKLGDCYIGPIKVYIPRYFRTGGQENRLWLERLKPVEAGGTAVLTARSGTVRSQMRVSVTGPDGLTEEAAYEKHADVCQGAYQFRQPGLYQVACRTGSASTVCYVRCYTPGEAPPEDGTEDEELPGWLLPPEDGEAPDQPAPPETEPEETLPDDNEIPGWLLS